MSWELVLASQAFNETRRSRRSVKRTWQREKVYGSGIGGMHQLAARARAFIPPAADHARSLARHVHIGRGALCRAREGQ